MRLPYGTRPHDGEVPRDDEAFGIAGEEALIAADERRGVDLGLVAAEDALWLGGGRLARHVHGGRSRPATRHQEPAA